MLSIFCEQTYWILEFVLYVIVPRFWSFSHSFPIILELFPVFPIVSIVFPYCSYPSPGVCPRTPLSRTPTAGRRCTSAATWERPRLCACSWLRRWAGVVDDWFGDSTTYLPNIPKKGGLTIGILRDSKGLHGIIWDYVGLYRLR